jgi:DNA polymerase-3 subunit chi
VLVRFYLTGSRPVEEVLPAIARGNVAAGNRMLVVAEEDDLLGRVGRQLWEQYPEDFLAHGRADQGQAARQPILLSRECDPANGARLIALADGRWRDEAERFDRVFLFFDDDGRVAARQTWAQFKERTDIEREFWQHADGKWQQVKA